MQKQKLYSHNGNYPTILPEKIVINGLSYTGLSSLPDYQLNELGFTGPYYSPDIDSDKEKITWNSETESFILEPLSQEDLLKIENEKWESIRIIRNKLLEETDWIVIKSLENDELIPSNYSQYRKELRDIPQKYESASDVIFPVLGVDESEIFTNPLIVENSSEETGIST